MSEIETAGAIHIPECTPYTGSGVRFRLDSANGPVLVRTSGADRIFMRGSAEMLIGLGVLRPEWVPGQPHTKKTQQLIIFEDSGPALVQEKVIAKYLRVPFALVHRWEHKNGATVEADYPTSETQRQAVESIWEAYSRYWRTQEDCPSGFDAPQRPRYVRQGNVLHVAQWLRTQN